MDQRILDGNFRARKVPTQKFGHVIQISVRKLSQLQEPRSRRKANTQAQVRKIRRFQKVSTQHQPQHFSFLAKPLFVLQSSLHNMIRSSTSLAADDVSVRCVSLLETTCQWPMTRHESLGDAKSLLFVGA